MAQPTPTIPPVPPELREPLDPAERERALAAAEAEIEAGRGVPQERARAWLLELAAGRRTPPPACE